MLDTHHTAITLIAIALLSLFLFAACSPKAPHRVDVTRQILNYADIGAARADGTIADMYLQLIEAHRIGLVSDADFIVKRDRLDVAEQALDVLRKAMRSLNGALAASQTDSVIEIVLNTADSVMALHDALVAAGVPVPDEISSFVQFLNGFLGLGDR